MRIMHYGPTLTCLGKEIILLRNSSVLSTFDVENTIRRNAEGWTRFTLNQLPELRTYFDIRIPLLARENANHIYSLTQGKLTIVTCIFKIILRFHLSQNEILESIYSLQMHVTIVNFPFAGPYRLFRGKITCQYSFEKQ